MSSESSADLDEFALASLVASRICHDLISPVAAVSTGVEVLEDDDESMRAHAMELLRTSSQQAGARLEFARLAFGAAGSMGDKINLCEAQRLTARLFSYIKPDLDWAPADQEVDKDFAKTIMNLCLLASETIPRGGAVAVRIAEDLNFEIVARGPRAKLYDPTRAVLTDPGASVDAKTTPAYLARRLLARLGMDLAIRETEDGVTFAVAARGRDAEAAA